MSYLDTSKYKISFETYKERIELKHIDKEYKVLGFIGEWIGNKTKLIMKCPDHGEWSTGNVNNLMSGYACQKCAILFVANTKRSNTKIFVERSNIIHYNLYNYSKSNYITNTKKIIIECAQHGEFLQTPASHLNGNGCPTCGSNIPDNNLFIFNSNNVHNNKYDYSKTIYHNMVTKVIILCKEHGEFLQTPHNHLHGRGCSLCAKSGYNPKYDGYIYICKVIHRFTGYSFTGYGKTKHPDKRLCQHKCTASKEDYEIVDFVYFKTETGYEASIIENELRKYKKLKGITINGFRKENTLIENYEKILQYLKCLPE